MVFVRHISYSLQNVYKNLNLFPVIKEILPAEQAHVSWRKDGTKFSLKISASIAKIVNGR